MSGTWDKSNLPARPGVYINVVEAAQQQIQGGELGIVALPLATYGTATAQRFYSIKTEQDAIDAFGAANIGPIKLALQGGCKEVLVYTLQVADGTTVTEADAYEDARNKFAARPFDVFVYGEEVDAVEQGKTVDWLVANREEGKHFFVVFGGSKTDDLDPTIGNQRSVDLKDDCSLNLINGAIIDGVELSSAEFAPHIAGLAASTPLTSSLTYKTVPAEDTNRRLTNGESKTAITNGSLVLLHDGEKLKVELGITTSGKKLRAVKVRLTVQVDLTKTVGDTYIGKITNDADGQKFLISTTKLYLEQIQAQGIINNITVELDPNFPPTGDSCYLAISYVELDALERVFITVNI